MRYKIVNRKRFITFITIVVLLFTFTIVTSFNLILAHGYTEPHYIEIQVSEGDTLWDIARQYGNENTDIRETIYNICHANNITASELKANQIIIIPCNEY